MLRTKWNQKKRLKWPWQRVSQGREKEGKQDLGSLYSKVILTREVRLRSMTAKTAIFMITLMEFPRGKFTLGCK